MPIKRGSAVRAVRDKITNSLEALANDSLVPEYIFRTQGEILDIREDYVQVKFGAVPTPAIWLRMDQVEEIA